MKWSEICIQTTHEAVEPVSNILHEAGASGVVIEDRHDLEKQWDAAYDEVYQLDPEDYPDEGVYIKAYLPVTSFLGETVEEIKQAVNNLLLYDIDIGQNRVTISEVNEEEWATAWKKYYKPVRVSKRLTVIPTWETYEPHDEKELVIELDPGLAFGTGTHPTTVMCIRALEEIVRQGDICVDVGTGSGVLSVVAAKLGARKVMAVDLDEIAVKSARVNVKLNGVQEKVVVKQGNLLDSISGPVDVIMANLLAEIILRLANDARRVLRKGGYLIASGLIQAKKDEVQRALENAGFSIVKTLEIDEWVTLVAKVGE